MCTPASEELGTPIRSGSPIPTAGPALSLLRPSPQFPAEEVELNLSEIMTASYVPGGIDDDPVQLRVQVVPANHEKILVRYCEGRPIYESLWQIKSSSLSSKKGAKLDQLWLTRHHVELLIWHVKLDDEITCEKIMTSDYEEGFYYSLSLIMDPFRDAYHNKTRISSMPIVGFREQPVSRTRSEPAQRIRKAQDIPGDDQQRSIPATPNNV